MELQDKWFSGGCSGIAFHGKIFENNPIAIGIAAFLPAEAG